MSNYEDVLYETVGRTAIITINRPSKYNAFRPRTVVELLDAFQQAGWNRDIGSIVFTGAGGKAFCTGGDQSDHAGGQYGNNDARGAVGMPVEELHSIIRDVPKPVIAKVRGYAIGGGNVFCTLCDMTIASDNAIFGQVGPKMGSVDPGFGTALLSRVVGEKKAREIWFMCRRYSAADASKKVAMAEIKRLTDEAAPHHAAAQAADRTLEGRNKLRNKLTLATNKAKGGGVIATHAGDHEVDGQHLGLYSIGGGGRH
jgi:dihydroxynaphthoic acid synthetase